MKKIRNKLYVLLAEACVNHKYRWQKAIWNWLDKKEEKIFVSRLPDK